MGKGKKTGYIPRPFESGKQYGDTSANIYHSMLLSDAWKDLTANQKVLYLACKDQYYGEKRRPDADDRQCFTMNRHKWLTVYELYSTANERGFYRDMKELINHGFVECLFSGKFNHQKSVYRLSSAWQRWQPGITQGNEAQGKG